MRAYRSAAQVPCRHAAGELDLNADGVIGSGEHLASLTGRIDFVDVNYSERILVRPTPESPLGFAVFTHDGTGQ